MRKYLKIVSPLVFLISLILIYSLRTLPKGQLWKSYSVIYVDKNAENQRVMQIFDNMQIKNVVSLNSQFLPVVISENSVEYAMLRLNYSNPDFDYLTKRSSFFYDKGENYRLYYIPREYSSKIADCLHLINSLGIECGTDAAASYPFMIPIILFILCAVLLLFTKNKIPYTAGIILPYIFACCNPFYPAALAVCLVVLGIFFLANVWKRRNLEVKIKQNTFIFAMAGAALISSFSVSVACSFLFVLTILGTAGSLYTCYFVTEYFRNKKPFVPVYIRSAKRVSIFAGKALVSMSAVSFCAVLLVAVLFLTSSTSFQTKVSKLLLPASSNEKNEKLPQFDDYYRLVWNIKTYPVKSINAETQSEDRVEFPQYVENPQTGIIEEQKYVLTYDNAFKKSVYDDIENLSFDSLEKVMKSEGDNFTAGYSSTNSVNITIFSIIMSFICVFILLFIYFSIIIRKGITK